MRLLAFAPASSPGRFRQFNPRISCRERRLQGVSKNERLTRRFPGLGFGAENPTETVLFCCLTKLCIIPPSRAVKNKTVRRSLDLAAPATRIPFTCFLLATPGGAGRSDSPAGDSVGPFGGLGDQADQGRLFSQVLRRVRKTSRGGGNRRKWMKGEAPCEQ